MTKVERMRDWIATLKSLNGPPKIVALAEQVLAQYEAEEIREFYALPGKDKKS